MKREIKWWEVIALIILISGVILTIWSAQQKDLSLRSDLLIKTNIAMMGVSTEQLKALDGSAADLASPEYQALKAQLEKIRATDPSIRFAYLMGQKPDGIFIYVDSEPPGSGDYSPPGQLYTEAPGVLKSIFKTGDFADEGPYSDRWGTWVSGFIPVTDPATGRVIAIFGMDVDAKDWNYTIAYECAAIIIASLLILVLVVTFGLIQRRTQREQRRLAASEDKFSRAFHTNPALMAVSSIEEGRFLDVNQSFVKTLGYSWEEVIGRTPSDLGLYSNPAQWDIIQSQLKERGQLRDVDIKVIRKDHGTLDGSFSAIPIEVNGIPSMLSVILDITDRKHAEEALYMSLVMDGVPTRLSYVDADLRFVYTNKAYAERFGRTREDLAGKSIMEVYGEEVFRQDLPNYQRVLSGEPVSFESNTNDTEGREYFEIITLVPHYSGELVSGFFASIMDITERKRAEEALRGSDAKQRAMITNITDVIAIIDAQGIIRYKSENIEKIFGWTPEELVGLSFRETAHPDDVEQITTVFMKLLQEDNASTTVEYRYRHKHGSFHMIHLTAKNLVHDPPINGVLVNYHDITDRKLAEDTLLRVNQKLNILSQLTRQDLTTQIFVLKSYLDMAKKQATGQDGIIKNIESSERAIWSIKRITEFTKDYQDMGAKPPTWQNVKMALLFGLSHITIGNIQHSLETENLEIYADPLLEKVCQRLFENSVAHGGHVTRIRVWHTITPGGVTIVFEDDGIGIPQEKKEQIFLRSEGTSPSRGSLVFVREILDITGIAIKETGEPGKGARFEMVVPAGAWRFAGTRKE